MVCLPLRTICILLLPFFFYASKAAAYDFTAADTLYHQRASGPAKINAALETYTAAIKSGLNHRDLVYAVEQQGRLYMYWGYIVNQANTNTRVQIANHCLKTVESIKPNNTDGEVPQYFFWKAACLMARANARGIRASLSESQKIADAIDAGIGLDPAYEGGGFDRLGGVLYSKLPLINPFGPRGDMPRALRHFRRALDAGVFNDPLFPDWKDPDTESGEYFFSTYVYYVEALHANGDTQKARQVAEGALSRINDGDLPVGREPEAMVAKANLERLLRALQ